MKRLLLLMIIGTAISSTTAQSIRATYSSNPIKIDGVLDDQWALADSAFDFNQYFPFDSSLAEAQTIAKILYDDNNIYVLVS